MEKDVERKLVAILKILSTAKESLGAREISRKLADDGIRLTERAVRFHLQLMDEKGLTHTTGKLARAGRVITEKGREELSNALVSDKVGMVSGRMDELSYKTNFDLETQSGDIILNVSMIHNEDFPKAIEIVREVIKAKFSMGNLVLIAKEGDEIGDMLVPKGMTALATVCAVTINGILLHHRIPVKSRFGGLLQIENHKPLRFTEIIEYSGSSLDPAEIFIKSKMTSVLNAVRSGSGKVLAGFREIPIACLQEAENILNRLAEIGLYGTVVIGQPNQPVVQIPVSSGYAGLVILAGLNPLGAVEEIGINTQNASLCIMMDFKKLTPLD
jgi:HTH-type transcriptional regulator, global nitrogen regulator NrpRI